MLTTMHDQCNNPLLHQAECARERATATRSTALALQVSPNNLAYLAIVGRTILCEPHGGTFKPTQAQDDFDPSVPCSTLQCEHGG